MDLSAFDIPVIVAGATRNWKSFLEACLEATWSSGALIFAPFLTKTIAQFSGNLILNSEEKNNAENIARFAREDLVDEQSFLKGIE
ncbi:MAG: hypothetical protein ACK43K_07550, partial [Chitinophagales bacterium]